MVYFLQSDRTQIIYSVSAFLIRMSNNYSRSFCCLVGVLLVTKTGETRNLLIKLQSYGFSNLAPIFMQRQHPECGVRCLANGSLHIVRSPPPHGLVALSRESQRMIRHSLGQSRKPNLGKLVFPSSGVTHHRSTSSLQPPKKDETALSAGNGTSLPAVK